jgi:hypothetical protein
MVGYYEHGNKYLCFSKDGEFRSQLSDSAPQDSVPSGKRWEILLHTQLIMNEVLPATRKEAFAWRKPDQDLR